MASQSDSSVSVELGELLELLNALEAQDSRPLENFATLERLLAAGKGSPAELSEDYQPDDHQRDAHQPGDHQRDDYQRDDHPSEIGFGDGISGASEQSSSGETIADHPDWREENEPEDDRGADDKAADERPAAEIENRLAVHIIQGLRKSMKDWAS